MLKKFSIASVVTGSIPIVIMLAIFLYLTIGTFVLTDSSDHTNFALLFTFFIIAAPLLLIPLVVQEILNIVAMIRIKKNNMSTARVLNIISTIISSIVMLVLIIVFFGVDEGSRSSGLPVYLGLIVYGIVNFAANLGTAIYLSKAKKEAKTN